MNAAQPAGWPKDRPMAVCVNIPLEWWAEGVAPGISPFGYPLKAGYVDLAARQWAEYGLKQGIFRMLDIAESLGIKVSCHMSGIVTETHPEAALRAHSGGHEIQAHCWTQHKLLGYMNREEEDAEMKRCIRAQEELTGQRPIGFAVPRGTLSPNTEELLAINGFKFYADDMSGDLPKVKPTPAGPVVCVPYDMEVNDLGFHMKHGNPLMFLPQIVEDLIANYDKIGMPPTVMDMTFHAHVSGRIVGAIQFQKVMEMIAAVPWMWITTRTELATIALAEHVKSAGNSSKDEGRV